MTLITFSGEPLALADVRVALRGPVQVAITETARKKMTAARLVVERRLQRPEPVYGINTGFGIFARTKISPDNLVELQRNIVLSHAVGVGELLPDPIVRLMLVLKLQTLTLGYSGVRPELANALAAWLAADVLPCVPCQGSVGASGDLAPLAHCALALLGQGMVRHDEKIFSAADAIKQFRLPVVQLAAKEGLGLLNGTQAMLAVAIATVELAEKILAHADIASALTIEGLSGSAVPFDARLHAVRPHPGAVATAQTLRTLLAESEINASHASCQRVQDPYALRCVPSVHGAAREALQSVTNTITCELNSVTDNPIVFADDDAILSGGNFHGAPLALAMDYLTIALTTVASISERRIEQLINPKAGELPVMGLTDNPGLHSGMMVAHTTAASLVSENKTLAHPACVDTIPTWAGQEDHVSMGMWAARKAWQAAQNVLQVVAIELLCAAQALDLHPTKLRAGRGAQAAYDYIRTHVAPLAGDRYLAPDIAHMAQLIREGAIQQVVADHIA